MSVGKTVPTILLVEDEPALAESVDYNLEQEGFKVIIAADGATGLRLFRDARPSLILLDLMIPQICGLDLCRLIRAESDVPIIILTAKHAESDKVLALELGADDYITKPFSVRELIARIRAGLRRPALSDGNHPPGLLFAGTLVVDRDRHTVKVEGELVGLTPKEFAVLQLLVERKGRLVIRDRLIDEVWGPDFDGTTSTLDVHIRRIREKVEKDPNNPVHIQTVRGLGYKFVD